MSERALQAMRSRRTPLGLVIFDCDGVLIDSEPLCDRVVAAALTDLGWAMTPEESGRRFIGLAFPDMVPLIEAQIGRRLPDGWLGALVDEVAATMALEAVMVPGARIALEAATALGLPWRIASNSSHQEMTAKFARTGLSALVAGRLHSAEDVRRGKPAPDLFMAAAAAAGAHPQTCIVIEDSQHGVRAAIAAGMDCLGLSRHDDGAPLAELGAVPFHDMAALPELLRAAVEAHR